MADTISQDKVKFNVARIKKFGKTFEISVEPDKALQYKKGKITNLREVLLADNVFTDTGKGQVASQDELQKAFQTVDTNKVADIILKQGEIQLTAEHRAAEREKKRRYLVNLIHRQAVDPSTGYPHPPQRIEAALEQGKINLDVHKTVEEQFDDIIIKLRPVIPLKIEQKQFTITIPAQHAGKAYHLVKTNSKMLKEEWKSDGSWFVTVETPAGMYHEFLDKLNSVTHGDVVVGE